MRACQCSSHRGGFLQGDETKSGLIGHYTGEEGIVDGYWANKAITWGLWGKDQCIA